VNRKFDNELLYLLVDADVVIALYDYIEVESKVTKCTAKTAQKSDNYQEAFRCN